MGMVMKNSKGTAGASEHWHEENHKTGKRRPRQEAVDEALEQTFPASDPPGLYGLNFHSGVLRSARERIGSDLKPKPDRSKD